MLSGLVASTVLILLSAPVWPGARLRRRLAARLARARQPGDLLHPDRVPGLLPGHDAVRGEGQRPRVPRALRALGDRPWGRGRAHAGPRAARRGSRGARRRSPWPRWAAGRRRRRAHARARRRRAPSTRPATRPGPRRCSGHGSRRPGSRSRRTSSRRGGPASSRGPAPRGERPALCLTGHLDTVPLGGADWSRDAFGGEIDGDRLYGRGTSDMKGGTAAIVVAAERVAALGEGAAGLELVLCAGEETGCEGALALAQADGALGQVGALLVAEPTTNYPCVAHKGVVWPDAVARRAHRPRLDAAPGRERDLQARAGGGAARGLLARGREHPLLGDADRLLGTMSGGININSVPDFATAGIDVRTVPGLSGDDVLARARGAAGRRRRARAAGGARGDRHRSRRPLGAGGLRGHGAADRRDARAARPRLLHRRRRPLPGLRHAADDHLRPR